MEESLAQGAYFFMVIEDAITPKRSGPNHMPVSQDVTFLGIDNESGCLGRNGSVGVEGASLAEMYGYHVANNFFDGSLPLGGVGGGGDRGQRDAIFAVHFHEVLFVFCWWLTVLGSTKVRVLFIYL